MFQPVFRKRKEAKPRPSDFEAYWTKRRMWIVVTFSLMAATVSSGYYFAVYLPVAEASRRELIREQAALEERLEHARIDAEKERQLRWEDQQREQFESNRADKMNQGYQLDACLSGAEQDYVMLWDRECFARGLAQDCRLATDVSATLNGHLKDLKEECFRRFPQAPPGDVDAAAQS